MTDALADVDWLALGAGLLAGAALATLYLATLWRAVTGLVHARRPAVSLLGGAVLRVALVAAGFALAARGGVAPFLACLAGFFLVRVAVTRRVGAPATGREA